jgi:hypothetical protein
MSRYLRTVLILEAVVIALTIVPAVELEHVSWGSAGLAAGLAFVAAVVLSGLRRKFLPVTVVGGSILQLAVIASGTVIPVMYILGVIFTLLWVTGIWLGHQVENSS